MGGTIPRQEVMGFVRKLAEQPRLSKPVSSCPVGFNICVHFSVFVLLEMEARAISHMSGEAWENTKVPDIQWDNQALLLVTRWLWLWTPGFEGSVDKDSAASQAPSVCGTPWLSHCWELPGGPWPSLLTLCTFI